MSTRRQHLLLLASRPWLFLTVLLLHRVSTTVHAGSYYLYPGNTNYWCQGCGGHRLAETLLGFQRPVGGWPRDINPQPGDVYDKPYEHFATLKNGATVNEIRFMAQAHKEMGTREYLDAAMRGLNFILDSQHDTGGWGLFWPDASGYKDAITFNDNLHIYAMKLLGEVAQHQSPFDTEAWGDHQLRAHNAFNLGLQCIIQTQIKTPKPNDACPTAVRNWCSQHDKTTLAPISGLNYEPISFSGDDGMQIAVYLMSLNDPSEEVKEAIVGAYIWSKEVIVKGFDYQKGDGDSWLVENKRGELWPKFSQISDNEPIFCDKYCATDPSRLYTGIEGFSRMSRDRRGRGDWFTGWGMVFIDKFELEWSMEHNVSVSTDCVIPHDPNHTPSEAGNYKLYPGDKTYWCDGCVGAEMAATLVDFQRPTGGWPKNINPQPGDRFWSRQYHSTLDNGATVDEIRFMAHAHKEMGNATYLDSAVRGVEFILLSQFPRGGWPLEYPTYRERGLDLYKDAITFNDDVHINAMKLLNEVANMKSPFDTQVWAEHRKEAWQAQQLALKCILDTQISTTDARSSEVCPTQKRSWCSQYDKDTLECSVGRDYEPAALSAWESVNIALYLMSIEDPSPEIKEAIVGAYIWVKETVLKHYEIQEIDGDRILVEKERAELWPRYTQISRGRPIFCSRGCVDNPSLAYTSFPEGYALISHERRNGYYWLGTWGLELISDFEQKWSLKHHVAVSSCCTTRHYAVRSFDGATHVPTSPPVACPTVSPTMSPTAGPTTFPTSSPTSSPTFSPTALPTASPTGIPTSSPIVVPTIFCNTDVCPKSCQKAIDRNCISQYIARRGTPANGCGRIISNLKKKGCLSESKTPAPTPPTTPAPVSNLSCNSYVCPKSCRKAIEQNCIKRFINGRPLTNSCRRILQNLASKGCLTSEGSSATTVPTVSSTLSKNSNTVTINGDLSTSSPTGPSPLSKNTNAVVSLSRASSSSLRISATLPFGISVVLSLIWAVIYFL